MKAERSYPVFAVTPKAEAAIHRGHPWVYAEEITAAPGNVENGALVDVVSNPTRMELTRLKGRLKTAIWWIS